MIHVHALTDRGKVREDNQDSILIREPEDESTRRRRGTLVAVADGMGGLEDGKIASQLVVDALRDAYASFPGEACEALEQAVKAANRAVYEYALAKENGQPMGSTCTALALMEHYACIAHVGDSRAYHYHKGTLHQITRDHSLYRELADRGDIDPASLEHSVHRNVLTRGLGLKDEVDVDVFELTQVEDGDLLLLSSDGLHELVREEDLINAVEQHAGRLDELCRHLVDLANSRGGIDNITVAVARMGELPQAAAAPGPESVRPAPERGAGEAPQRFGCLLPLVIVLSFCAGVVLTLWVASLQASAAEARTAKHLHDLLQALEDGRTDVEGAKRFLEVLLER